MSLYTCISIHVLVAVLDLQVVILPYIILQQRTWARIVQLVVVFGFAGGYPTLPFCSGDLQVVIPPYHFAAAHLGTHCSWWLLWICRWLSHLISFCSSAPGHAFQLVAVTLLICRWLSHLPPYHFAALRRAQSAAGSCCGLAGGCPTF